MGVSSPSPLPRLMPVALLPPRPLERNSHQGTAFDTSAAAALGRVLAVEVDSGVDADRSTLYHVRVAVRSTRSRIPVAVVPGRSLPRFDKGVIVVSRRFAPFRKLRDDVYYSAQGGHVPGDGPTRSCSFCAGVVDAVLLDQMQPHRYDEWVRSTEAVCRRLGLFLEDLVGRARGNATTTSTGRPRCVVQANVQSLIVQFLELDQHGTDP